MIRMLGLAIADERKPATRKQAQAPSVSRFMSHQERERGGRALGSRTSIDAQRSRILRPGAGQGRKSGRTASGLALRRATHPESELSRKTPQRAARASRLRLAGGLSQAARRADAA